MSLEQHLQIGSQERETTNRWRQWSIWSENAFCWQIDDGYGESNQKLNYNNLYSKEFIDKFCIDFDSKIYR